MTTPKILPVPISDLQIAFPADALDYMPAWDDIPDEFKHDSPWIDFQRTWFSLGLSNYFSFQPVEGVDARMAFRQLSAIQGSYASKHEHKMAAVAYLSSLWMDCLIYGKKGAGLDECIALGDGSLQDWKDYFAEHPLNERQDLSKDGDAC